MDNILYLNNAATSWPKAPGVANTVSNTLLNIPSSPGRSISRSTDILTESRELFAQLINISNPSRIIITQHATHSLNLALLGLGLTENDVVVTSVMEHNSVLRPLNHLKESRNIKVITIGLDKNYELDCEQYIKALDLKPKVVVLNYVSNVTGIINDIAFLFLEAKKRGAITVLDASQAAGHINIDTKTLNADIIAVTGHKALRGPQGVGFLYVSSEIELKQVIVGGTGIRSDLTFHPENMPIRLEAGTYNIPAIAGMNTALKWFIKGGNDYIDKCKQATEKLRKGIKDISNIKVFDNSTKNHLGIISFVINGWDVEDLGYVLVESFGIINRAGLHCAPLMHKAIGSSPNGTVRLSPSGSTSDNDIDRVLDAIKKLSSCK